MPTVRCNLQRLIQTISKESGVSYATLSSRQKKRKDEIYLSNYIQGVSYNHL